jgi:hypothetical protein
MIRLRGLLGGPFPGWVQGDSQDADAPGGVLDHGQDVGLSAVKQVDREEVARQDRVGLRAQELRSGRTVQTPGGLEAAGPEDLPNGGRCDLNSEAGQFAVDPAVPIRGSREPVAGPGPGYSAGSSAGQSCRARTWRPSAGERGPDASAGSCRG